MPKRVIGLGQAAAGDDGVGAVVAQELKRRRLPAHMEVLELPDPSALVEMFEADASPVVLIDAVLGEPPGQVLELTPQELAGRLSPRLSSHGLGVREAIELARALRDGVESPMVRIVAVTIARPSTYQQGLSPEVAAAVPLAVERVLRCLGETHA